jgi:hypothetical protein
MPKPLKSDREICLRDFVRQVVDRHAGSIAIGESPAGGSRLTMVLPGSDA